MSGAQLKPLIVNGWTLFAHPLFLTQLEEMTAHVAGLKQKDPAGYGKKNVRKRLAAINKLAFEIIPQDPARAEYRQGKTLDASTKQRHSHWFRAKFYQQYRLFFRYHAASQIIVYAWVNDAETKRSYESSDDAYRVFRKMLENGHPPDDWDALVCEARDGGKNFSFAD